MPKSNDLATKTFVKKTVEEATDNLRNELTKKMGGYHNEVMKKLDSIAGSIKKFDEEQTALSYRVSEHTDQLENHEKRIKKVEKTASLPAV